jgi:NitT/TauT family transport system substrate-binding protein
VINEHRDMVKVLIKALMTAQHESERDRVAAIKDTVGTYYKASFEVVLDASTTQYLMVDQRSNQQFMLERSQSVAELGYIKKPIDASSFDWSILEEVVAENRDLYRSLIVV